MLPVCNMKFKEEILPPKVLQVIKEPDLFKQIRFLDFLIDPFYLGIENEEYTFQLSHYSNSAIFRFVTMNGDVIPWPQTFEIKIFGKWMKKPEGYSLLINYLPDAFKTKGEIEFKSLIDNPSYFLIIQECVVDVSLRNYLPSVYQGSGSPMSPISGQKMKYPVRSHNCKHSQCVDLDEYVEFVDNLKECPFCGKKAEISSIVIDSSIQMMNYRSILRQASPNAENEDYDWKFSFD